MQPPPTAIPVKAPPSPQGAVTKSGNQVAGDAASGDAASDRSFEELVSSNADAQSTESGEKPSSAVESVLSAEVVATAIEGQISDTPELGAAIANAGAARGVAAIETAGASGASLTPPQPSNPAADRPAQIAAPVEAITTKTAPEGAQTPTIAARASGDSVAQTINPQSALTETASARLNAEGARSPQPDLAQAAPPPADVAKGAPNPSPQLTAAAQSAPAALSAIVREATDAAPRDGEPSAPEAEAPPPPKGVKADIRATATAPILAQNASATTLSSGERHASLASPELDFALQAAPSSDVRSAVATTPPPTPIAATRDASATIAQIAAAASRMTGDRVEVRLDPPELGRVVLSFVIRDDQVFAQVSAERQETADLLRRNGDELQKSLREGGFEDVSLEFGADGDGAEASEPADAFDERDDAPSAAPVRRSPTGGLDIRV